MTKPNVWYAQKHGQKEIKPGRSKNSTDTKQR